MYSSLKIGDLAKIEEIAKEDLYFPYRATLLDKNIRIDFFARSPDPREPWFFVTGFLDAEVWLNGRKIEKGGFICFRKVKLVSSLN